MDVQTGHDWEHLGVGQLSPSKRALAQELSASVRVGVNVGGQIGDGDAAGSPKRAISSVSSRT
jgi:hypothetical protein